MLLFDQFPTKKPNVNKRERAVNTPTSTNNDLATLNAKVESLLTALPHWEKRIQDEQDVNTSPE